MSRRKRSKKPPELPAPCVVCGPQGGLWIETPTGRGRCKCDRGRKLLGLDISEGGYRPKKAPRPDHRKLAAGDND